MNAESLFFLGVGLGGGFVALFGYRLFQSAITLIGTVAGGLYGVTIMQLATGEEPALWILAAGGLVGALVGMGSAIAVYYLGIFAAGGYLGFWFAGSLVEGFSLPYPWAIIIILTALTGFATLALERWTLIVITAAVGAWHLTASIGYFTAGAKLLPYRYPFEEGNWIEGVEATTVMVATGLFILGFMTQKFLTARRTLRPK